MRGPTSVRRARCIASSTLERVQVRRPHYAAPELLATRPNALELGYHQTAWAGHVDLLLSLDPRHLQSLRGRLDDRVARECGPRRASHRRHLRQARHSQLTLHADRGTTPRRPRVTKTHSRPHVSDNRFLKQFKTLKYGPLFPELTPFRASFPGTTRRPHAFSRPRSCTSGRPPRSARTGSRYSRPSMSAS